MRRLILLATALVIALVAAPAFAEPGEGDSGDRPSREEILEKFDKDGDGTLDEAERAEMREAMRKRRGGEGQRRGELGGEGRGERRRVTREELLKEFDTNGDGTLDETERMVAREAMKNRRGGEGGGEGRRPTREEITKKFDADGDGTLDETERAAMREAMRNRRGGEGQRRGEGEGGGRGEGEGLRPTREEILKKFDADGDGTLDETERAAMREAMRNRRGGEGRRRGGEGDGERRRRGHGRRGGRGGEDESGDE